jgi:hypothetical protein
MHDAHWTASPSSRLRPGAYNAATTINKGLEGGLSALKTAEVKGLAKNILK